MSTLRSLNPNAEEYNHQSSNSSPLSLKSKEYKPVDPDWHVLELAIALIVSYMPNDPKLISNWSLPEIRDF